MGTAAISAMRRGEGDAGARAVRTIAGVAIATMAVVAGVGSLYLLRAAGLFGVGPRLHGALPLQQLAGDDGQPLVRMAAAWISAGAAAGVALGRLRGGRGPGAVVVAVALVLLVLTGAVSDAVASSEPVAVHLLPQLASPGLWAALVLMTAAAALAGRRAAPPAMAPVLSATAIALLLAGAMGVTSYVWHYSVYRGFPPPKDPAGVAAGRALPVNFYSPALHQRRYYIVYLPPGYSRAAAAGVRFPVLYLLHAPPGKPENYLLAGALGVKLDRLIHAGRVQPFLIVMPNGKSGTFGNDTEWANARAGAYENFVLDVVRAVDKRWATQPQRAYRAIGGLSEGAYGATNVALHHPGVFGTLESWSGYFEQTPTLSFSGASRSELWANSPSAYVPSIAPALRRLGMHAYLYQGNRDSYPVARLASFARELRAAGVSVRVSLYPGGHNWGLWRMELPHMLEFASRSFGAP